MHPERGAQSAGTVNLHGNSHAVASMAGEPGPTDSWGDARIAKKSGPVVSDPTGDGLCSRL